MQLKIGDKVGFLNEKGKGIVSGIISKTYVYVRIEEGFDIPCEVKELVLVQEINPEALEHAMMQKKSSEISRPKKPVQLIDPEIEIDLHIDELIESHAGMNNSQILDVQLKHFKNELEDAIHSNVKKITFIHGVGTGRLKQEIYKILKTYEKLRFHDASYARYGFGATEIVLR
jgi:dsDNA-specific endonuclease/ATPase MutS2